MPAKELERIAKKRDCHLEAREQDDPDKPS